MLSLTKKRKEFTVMRFMFEYFLSKLIIWNLFIWY